MSEAKVKHTETWSLTITPEEDDIDWPGEHQPVYMSSKIRPDRIVVVFSYGEGRYDGSVSGYRIMKNGQVSDKLRHTERFYGGSGLAGPHPPDWAKLIIETALSEHHLIGKVLGSE